MKVLLQRVRRAEVRVAGEVVGRVGSGLLILIGIEQADGPELLGHFAAKAAEVRIFPDDEGQMNRSVEQVGGEILVVSQFTLAADTRKGRRPSFARAAEPHKAKQFYSEFCRLLRDRGLKVETGVFQADMDVESINHGPVTLLLDPPRGSVS